MQAIGARVKGGARLEQKAAEREGDALADMLGGRLWIDDPNAMPAVICWLDTPGWKMPNARGEVADESFIWGGGKGGIGTGACSSWPPIELDRYGLRHT